LFKNVYSSSYEINIKITELPKLKRKFYLQNFRMRIVGWKTGCPIKMIIQGVPK